MKSMEVQRRGRLEDENKKGKTDENSMDEDNIQQKEDERKSSGRKGGKHKENKNTKQVVPPPHDLLFTKTPPHKTDFSDL